MARACLEWQRGQGYVTTYTLKRQPLTAFYEVTTRNARFGAPYVQVARARKVIKRGGTSEVYDDVAMAYYSETGRDLLEDLDKRPRTVGKVFLSLAKRLERSH